MSQKPKINKFEHAAEWHRYIGKKIEKHSGKPFKSGKKIEKVIGTTVNEFSKRFAFILTDESVVDCMQCKLVKL
jgi:hypothetical protein